MTSQLPSASPTRMFLQFGNLFSGLRNRPPRSIRPAIGRIVIETLFPQNLLYLKTIWFRPRRSLHPWRLERRAASRRNSDQAVDGFWALLRILLDTQIAQ